MKAEVVFTGPLICANCGRELTLDTMQYRYLPSGCGREIVCRDDRTCEPTMKTIVTLMDHQQKGRYKVNHKSITSYRELSNVTAISFAAGIEQQNRRMAYMAQKARETRAREKEYQRKLMEEVLNVHQ